MGDWLLILRFLASPFEIAIAMICAAVAGAVVRLAEDTVPAVAIADEAFVKAIDHASGMSDRWLFLCALGLLLAAGVMVIRYLVNKNDAGEVSRNDLMNKMVIALYESTQVSKDLKGWLEKQKEK